MSIDPPSNLVADLPPPPLPEPSPWGFWATLGWSILIAIAFVVLQTVVLFIYEWAAPQADVSEGVFLAIASNVTGAAVVALSILFARLRKGITVKQYLGLQRPSQKNLIRWSILLLLFVVCSDGLTSLLGKPIVNDFMADAYTSAGRLVPLLWIALLVAAPFSEEFFFRGFLFAGLRRSLGLYAAIVITAALWAITHVQYDAYGIATIFVGGIFMGIARAKTESLWTCVILHALMNFIALCETIVHLAIIEN